MPADGTEGGGYSAGGGAGGGVIDLLSVSSSEDRRQTEALVFIEVNAGTRALRLGGGREEKVGWLGWLRAGGVCKNPAI